MSSDAAAQALRALSQFLVAERSVGDTLLRVSQITIDALPPADMAAITLLGDDGRPTTGIFTDTEAPEIDAAQYDAGRGPCLDAWREKRVVVLEDMVAAAADYPEFSRVAQAHGVGSVLSLPLVAGDAGLGALNLYARSGKRSRATTRPPASSWPRQPRSCSPTPARTGRPPSSASSWPRP